MKENRFRKKAIAVLLFSVLCSLALIPITEASYQLPPPHSIAMNLEQTIFRRMSIRAFTNETITDEKLSTILWNAAGYRVDGNRTIAGINGTFSNIIYVLKEDAAYTYNPANHSLQFYKPGDWRSTVGYQYPTAPLVLGLCYNTTKANPDQAGIEIGEICQNLAFTLDALNLGAVVTGGLPPAIDKMGIPTDQAGLIVMPVGHPLQPYNFKDRPLRITRLPPITETPLNLTTAIENRTETTTFTGTITRQQFSQLIWSSYGFSPYIDRSHQDLNKVKRHRTVPSAHGYYPLVIYAITQTGVYRYQPNLLNAFLNMFSNFSVDYIGLPVITYLLKIRPGDNRARLATASSLPSLATAPLTLIMVLNKAKTGTTGDQYLRFWYLEAGASAHTVMLEATALGLHTNIATPTDAPAIRSLLHLNDQFMPLLIVPIGS
jgi:nitroreductase